jgi:L-asparagine permease
MFGAPWTGLITLVFLLAVLVLMAMDYPVGTYTIASIALIVPLLIAGWFMGRGNIRSIAAARVEAARETSTPPLRGTPNA